MVGVGGQGIVLAGNVLCRAALNDNLDVKKSEIHGMAQRGGSVVSHVRFGDEVFSPSIPLGGADFILSFEKMEYLRYLNYANKESVLLLNSRHILPPSVSLGQQAYPDAVADAEKARFAQNYELDADSAAEEAGNAKTAGIVMLGALARLLKISDTAWSEAISASVPAKVLEANQKAFNLGKLLAK
jgi:indolepyruvate ferredoxin oxidoreductase beta subunit